MNKPTDRWKAERHDWLVEELRSLISRWRDESDKPGHFSPEAEADRTARGRTFGCSVELARILDE